MVNPWIHDFAAYDFWAKPLGLLTLAAILRQHDFTVSYQDCLDRFHPKSSQTDPLVGYGRGPYLKTRIKKPKGFDDVSRNFSRYGIKPEWFKQDLLSLPRPDLVLITSLMTYWYPGVQETVNIVKETFPDAIVVLGGIYTTLCQQHAVMQSGADHIAPGPGESQILQLASDYIGYSVKPKFDPDDFDTYPYPALDLQRKVTYVPLLTSRGCPFSCAYCASHFLHPRRTLRKPEAVSEEIQFWHNAHGVEDFVFYDDALLVDAEQHAVPMFEEIIKTGLKIRFHTPNALHIRGITPQTADLMFKAGFETIRLGLETAAFGKINGLDTKVTTAEFREAVTLLQRAGFKKDQIGAYLLVGLPDQTLDSIAASIQTVKQNNITPVPAYYSPIPHTALWDRAVACSRYDLEGDPIYTNNAVFPCQTESFSWETVSYLKHLVTL
ncbi:B12-binding domain-containing radical SAM protein [Thermodesulfobacteriota bacterium]